ncbi:hypothetical protein [Sphingomonas jatrophae]|uniref:Uncharacterized protein n=1 Tax=Sphingomonas jatrophae TaxID=1166337 RepID=A0A1I6JLP6_9SPHN|nr:hypothetical protein [Sphingomonas jatrophae]SFR79902.1 hypothetical protein SAMN05192580_0487 [Sphingomonas jatrophae]
MTVIASAAHALRLAVAALVARPGLILLFVAVQTGSNLMRFWLGRVEALGGPGMLMGAVGWLFLIARTFVTQWLHVAAARLIDDRTVGLRQAFVVAGSQAMWFHGLILVSLAAFLVRLWLTQASGGFFAPAGRLWDIRELVLMEAGFLFTYAVFLPLIPGYFASVLGYGGEPTLRGSLRAARGHVLTALGAAMLLALPPALLRRALLGLLDDGGVSGVLLTALLDAGLTVVLMMLATGVYWGLYRDSLEGARGRVRAAEAAR